jgi:transcriptional regulator with XRE-family HTH domain
MQSEIANRDAPLSAGTVAYFQDRLRTRLYDLVIRELENYKAQGMTQAQLATRIGKRPDQVSRWLSGPGNWTLDTVSDLLLGISGGELGMTLERPAEASGENSRQPAAKINSFDALRGALEPSGAARPEQKN